MADGLQRFADSFTQQAASTLSRKVSRRGFLVRMTVVGSALTIAPMRYLLRPGSAWAATGCFGCASGTFCPNCADKTTLCPSSANSTFCCSLSGGANSCPTGTHACGWWRCCIPTTYCSSGYRYFVDCCDPNCESPHCSNNHCNSRVECCFASTWSNCNGNAGTIRCRAVLCVNPSQVYNCNPTPVFTENTCCQGSTAAPCPNIPSCCDTCDPC
jgi:hypothetical protein